METPKEPTRDLHLKLLQVNQNISRLNDLLTSRIVVHHLKKWFSVLLEFVMYLLFGLEIIVVLLIPHNPFQVSYDINGSVTSFGGIETEQLNAMLMLGKLVILLMALSSLGTALLLRRNRRKNAILQEAATEVKKLKTGYDRLLAEWPL